MSAQEWQPIETAPKDGGTIMAWGRYNSEPVPVRWGRKGWEAIWDGWQECQSDFGTEYRIPDPLSHWMPLPEPPLQGTDR